MKIEMLKDCFIGGGIHAKCGEIVEASDPKYLLAKGFAREVVKGKPGRPKGSTNPNAETAEKSKEEEPAKEPKKAAGKPGKKDNGKPKAADKPSTVPFSEVKKKAKALGIPCKGSRADIEAAIADKESK